jgi:hypothetical protein
MEVLKVKVDIKKPKIRQTTGEDLGHLKDLEISKYKREMKARMPITLCWLIFVNCGLISRLYLDISRSFKCPKSSPVVCLICITCGRFVSCFCIARIHFCSNSGLFLRI